MPAVSGSAAAQGAGAATFQQKQEDLMEKISQRHFDKSDLITVSCPQCSENLFTFSRNILEDDEGIQFSCSNCSALVHVCYSGLEHEIFVQCL
ncbi:MAG: hypothetical protein KIG96_05105 [Treponema sp.]|nr:hypothetical protein [Treponema sp.]